MPCISINIDRRGLAAFVLTVALSVATFGLLDRAVAVQPDEVLTDPALETRARRISAGLRCLVCQNQSIDDSNAPLARDLRLVVRERIKSGDTDEAVVAYVVDRYGEFVLLRPPLNAGTLVLWLAPAFLLVAASGLALRLWLRSGSAASDTVVAEAPLTSDERARLDAVLKRPTD
jgi:cytochrome c-type biogenesis protein CcmH